MGLAAIGVHPDSGIFLMLFCVVVVVLCDAGAYFAGRAWGRHKLAPEISPNKSVEGALGGIVLGTLGGLLVKLVCDLFWPQFSLFLPWSVALGLAFLLCPVGMGIAPYLTGLDGYFTLFTKMCPVNCIEVTSVNLI